MPLSDSPARYGSLTKLFHWLTALLILTAIPLGLVAENAPYATGEDLAAKATLFSIHKTVGIAAFFTALLRILWALTQTRPGLLHPERRLEAFAAHFAHWLLYGAMVIVPLSGWVHHAATTGFAPILWPFGQSLPFVAKSETLSHIASTIHFAGFLALALAILAHVAGALKHVLIDRDDTLRRMLPGQTTAPATPPKRDHLAPLAAAILWGAIIAFGTLTTPTPTAQPAALAEAPTSDAANWQVESGEIALTVSQFGSAVSGSFATWDAQIIFDETPQNGAHGTVEARIAIPSLTLGSVTSQALGPDFLAAEDHPTATFRADLLPAETGYLASGTLSLRGMERPLDLPFTLDINGNSATMQANIALDRRDFAIGGTIPEEGTLGFAVDLAITLTATRLTD
ncbi:MAG: cytochrome [Rhodobacteraceae bacterium]|nr:cytochrome [Paracoccaceae bacterium]